MILYSLLFTPQVNKLLCFDKPPHGYEYKLLQRYIQILLQTTLFMASLSLNTFQSHCHCHDYKTSHDSQFVMVTMMTTPQRRHTTRCN